MIEPPETVWASLRAASEEMGLTTDDPEHGRSVLRLSSHS